MIKRLRLKFIVINMGIATILLSAILGLVFYFTSARSGDREHPYDGSASPASPFKWTLRASWREDVRQCPYFTLQLGPGRRAAGRGRRLLRPVRTTPFWATWPRPARPPPDRLGVLEEYNLRYYRSDAPTSRWSWCSRTSPASGPRLDETGAGPAWLIGGLSFLAFLWVSVLLAPSGRCARWSEAWQQQRQFVAAASHELKTPLTVIMTNAELLQDEADRGQAASTLSSSILTMSRQMRALIEQMLELARTDSAESHLVLRPVDLSGLTARSLLPFEPLFFEQGLTLISQVDEGITVSGDEEALRRVLEILLDNAQKYSSPGGETQVTLHRRGRNHCALTVANQGEPIPPEARRQIFQRFYRADPARSRNGSFGLGLSIAEGIVAQHHGTIDVTCAGGFNRFRAELPCRQE